MLFVPMMLVCLFGSGQISQEKVYKCLIEHGVKHPKIVLGQSLLETGYYRCRNCSMDKNNLFGYGWDGKSYYSYNNWVESVANYARWQKKHYKSGDYYEFLKRIGYATSENYINDLKWIVRNKIDV